MPEEVSPSLREQTAALGQILKSTSEEEPSGTPSELSARAFMGWLSEAGPVSREPGYFADVAGNYDVFLNSNRDLWELFDLLEAYLPEDDVPPPPARTFVPLPLA